MSRWNDELQQCQLLYESDEGSLLAFKVAGGMDYVIFTVAQGLTAGDDVASFKDMTMQQCMAACTADNNCEAVAHPGLKARGACGLFNSVLDAEWVSRVNVVGDHLSTGQNW
jgi:histidinol phosphatase-like PHP family hydrolase